MALATGIKKQNGDLSCVSRLGRPILSEDIIAARRLASLPSDGRSLDEVGDRLPLSRRVFDLRQRRLARC